MSPREGAREMRGVAKAQGAGDLSLSHLGFEEQLPRAFEAGLQHEIGGRGARDGAESAHELGARKMNAARHFIQIPHSRRFAANRRRHFVKGDIRSRKRMLPFIAQLPQQMTKQLSRFAARIGLVAPPQTFDAMRQCFKPTRIAHLKRKGEFETRKRRVIRS